MAKLSSVLEEWDAKLDKFSKAYDKFDHKGSTGWKGIGTALFMLHGPVQANNAMKRSWGRGVYRDNVAFLTKDIPRQAVALKRLAEAYVKKHDSPKLSLSRAQTWTEAGRKKEQARADLVKAIAEAMDECARDFKSADLEEVPVRT